ncbi:hypothetical protein ASG80_16915 [Agromyces sp. Soil535]|nr:hypothetical protein ASG80_16915 [Agromyces sp. Soil535]
MLALAACAAGLSGCVFIPPVLDAGAHEDARSEVADVARSLYGAGTATTIEDYARDADEALARNAYVHLIGYEAYANSRDDGAIGRLQFRAIMPRSVYDDYVACFWSEFDGMGVAASPISVDAAVAHDFPCPPDAQNIEPPVDTSPVFVVPEGTEAVVIDVLSAAPADVTANDIVAEVTERMPQPTGPYQVAYVPAAIVVDGDIGFAIGQGGDCLLVKRTDAGVEVVHAPSILLEPGELGCRPDTALRPPEDLQAPH